MGAEKKFDESFQTGRYTLREEFNRLPQLNASIGVATNLDWEVLGTNADDTVIALDEGGGVSLTTKTGANDQVILCPHLDTAQSAWAKAGLWGTENSVRFEAKIKTGSAVTAQTLWAGLKKTNTSVIATDTDQIFFRYDPAVSSYWTLVHSRSNVDATFITNIAPAASTNYVLVIEIDADRKVHAWINDVQITNMGQLAALTDAVDLYPFVGVETTTTAAKNLKVRHIECSRAN